MLTERDVIAVEQLIAMFLDLEKARKDEVEADRKFRGSQRKLTEAFMYKEGITETGDDNYTSGLEITFTYRFRGKSYYIEMDETGQNAIIQMIPDAINMNF